MTSLPVLARFDPDKPTFLKSDRIADGTGRILMHTGDDKKSHRAVKLLRKIGKLL